MLTKITFSNYPNTLQLSKNDFEKELNKVISKQFSTGNISVIFVSSDKMKELNGEYRGIKEVTDVLSFPYEESNLQGEVYICHEYVLQSFKEEEIIRVIIHGILHILGYSHEENFVEGKSDEEMYIIQEKMVAKLIAKLF